MIKNGVHLSWCEILLSFCTCCSFSRGPSVWKIVNFMVCFVVSNLIWKKRLICVVDCIAQANKTRNSSPLAFDLAKKNQSPACMMWQNEMFWLKEYFWWRGHAKIAAYLTFNRVYLTTYLICIWLHIK